MQYKELLKLEQSARNNFKYHILKANVEYELGEFKLCKSSYENSIILMEDDELSLISLIELATLIGGWDYLFRNINLKKVFNKDYDDEFLDSCSKLIKAKISGTSFDVSELIKCAKTKKQKSISAYLTAIFIPNDEERLYDVALELFEGNLAAAEYLYGCGKELNIDIITKLIYLDMIGNKSVLESKREDELGLEFLPLGGGDNIGASSYFLKVKEVNILIDAGIKLEGNKVIYPNYQLLIDKELINKLDYVIITHAHLDHCGGIVELYKLNKGIKPIMTRETKELLRFNLKHQFDNENDLYILDSLLDRIIILDFNKRIYLRNEEVSIELYRAGHILGASSIMIRSDKCSIFHTGDFCTRDQETIEGIDFPIGEKIDVLITESTYGDSQCKSVNHECKRLKEFVQEKMNEGKQVLIPSFSIGRAQEILALISRKGESRARVYLDGSAVEASAIYHKYAEKAMGDLRYYIVDEKLYSSKKMFIEQEALSNSCCIVTSSGMLLEGSASSQYAKTMLGNDNCVCILTGYQAGGTLGLRLKEQLNFEHKYITIEDERIIIKAELNEFNLSAHANLNEILALELCLKANNVILIHGEFKDKHSILEDKLNAIDNVKVYQSKNNDLISL